MHNAILTHSWEYVTTLEYEWDVIRGRRPYRWTIWVRRYMRFNLVYSATPGSRTDLFVQLANRFTPLREFLPFSSYYLVLSSWIIRPISIVRWVPCPRRLLPYDWSLTPAILRSLSLPKL